MMERFVFPGLTTRVVFGSGTLSAVGEEVARLGHERVMILSTPQQGEDARSLAGRLGNLATDVFSDAAMHTPVEVTDAAIAAFRRNGATAVVSLGGGSAIGLGKAIAVRTGVDQIAVPTTYAGSEMTDILGETADGEKTTRRSADIRPETVVYDVDLTATLPVDLTVASAMNALAHAMEAFYAPDRNPVIVLMCLDAISAFRSNLPRLLLDSSDAAARANILYAAWCCSTALGSVSMALHHKLAHVFGGSFDTPHAQTHAALLPYTTAFNEAAVPDLLRPIAEAFGGGSAAGGLWDFARSVGAPLGLRSIGIGEGDLDRAASIALKQAYPNPRPIDRNAIESLLRAAYEGRRPGA